MPSSSGNFSCWWCSPSAQMSTQEDSWFWREVHTTDTEVGCSSPKKPDTLGQEDSQLRSLLHNHGDCNKVKFPVVTEPKEGCGCQGKYPWRSQLDSHGSQHCVQQSICRPTEWGLVARQGLTTCVLCWNTLFDCYPHLGAASHGCEEEILEMGWGFTWLLSLA